MDKYNNIDDIVESSEVKLKDGLDGLAEILGGIAVIAAENKKMLQSKNPGIMENGVKMAGVLGTGLVGIGASIAKFVANNTDAATRK